MIGPAKSQPHAAAKKPFQFRSCISIIKTMSTSEEQFFDAVREHRWSDVLWILTAHRDEISLYEENNMSDWLFQTSRLNWRSLSMYHDQAAIYRQFSDLEMCRFFDEPPCTLAEAQDIISHYAFAPTTAGYRRYALLHNQTGEFIGTCGYHFLNHDHQSVEIGYDIWKAHWRKGYAREVLPRLLEICFAMTSIQLVYAVIFPDNLASIGTVVSAGFGLIAPPPRLNDTTSVVYGMTRQAFYSTTRLSGSSS